MIALTAVGGWFSLSSKRVWSVVLKTFLLVTLIPWVLVHLAGYTTIIQRMFPSYSDLVVPAAFVTKNLLFIGWASFNVRRHFRAAAAQTHRLRTPKTILVSACVPPPAVGATDPEKSSATK